MGEDQARVIIGSRERTVNRLHSSDQRWQPHLAERPSRWTSCGDWHCLACCWSIETLFRVSLFEQILDFHTDPGTWNHLVDVLLAGLLEFKAVSLFSLMFGIGSAIQAERAAARGVNVTRFLVRRYLILLALGLCHLLLIWDGDILVLYAVCGLLIVPLLRLPATMLAVLGAALIGLPYAVDLPIPFPTASAMQTKAVAATRVYGSGSFMDILAFRYSETGRFIVPLLLGILPQTAGLMLCGIAAWRSGVLREPQRHKRLLGTFFVGALAIGATTSLRCSPTGTHAVILRAPSPVPSLAFSCRSAVDDACSRDGVTALRVAGADGAHQLSVQSVVSASFSILALDCSDAWGQRRR
jgi:hypothetical protein